MQQIPIGIAGFGTVGGGVYHNLERSRALLEKRIGCSFEVRRIAIRDRSKSRNAPDKLLTDQWQDLIDDPELPIVVELMGDIEAPLVFVSKALEAGKIVVTGNKALLAEHGPELFALAKKHRTPIFYEAAVAGGIPIIKAVKEAFVANHFQRFDAILNGTSNYILTRMAEGGLDFAEALAEAQAEGYAEADPTLDINGWDAAHKAIILASLAYGFWVRCDQLRVEGIESITSSDIRFADELGYKIKLLASIHLHDKEGVEARVVPTLIPKDHVLASVNGVFNAISLQGDIAGEALFYGRGAGQDPTSSAVIADLTEAALALQSPRRCFGFTAHDLYGKVCSQEKSISEYYLRLEVEDRTGVLAQIASVLAEKQIGISSVIQPEWHQEGPVPLVLMIHHAPYGEMLEAVKRMTTLDCVKSKPRLWNVESFK